MLIAGSAMAFVPSPITSTFGCAIRLVGRQGLVVDPIGTYTIVVKDIAGNAIPNAAVKLDFTACCNDVKVSSTQNWPGLTVDVTKKIITATADGSGTLVVRVQGMATNLTTALGARTGPMAGCMDVYANSGTGFVLLSDPNNGRAHVHVATYDNDGGLGGLGVTGADVSNFLTDWLVAADNKHRSDLDYDIGCVTGITGADLSALLTDWLGTAASTSNDAFTGACP
jgi:hypothetical protein